MATLTENDKTIYGPRYRCNVCYQFDMCFKCVRHVTIAHYKGHTFVKYDTAGNKLMDYDPWSMVKGGDSKP